MAATVPGLRITGILWIRIFHTGMQKNLLELQHLTAAEFSEHPPDKVILPLGSFESHGPHMPLGTDALTAHIIALEVAGRVPGTLVLPPLNYGVSEHYKQFPFTVSLRFETETAVITDILASLYREGIRKVFIMNGHDGNMAPVEAASRTLKVTSPEMRIVSLDAWWNTLAPLMPEGFFEVWNGLGHGGEGELSMGLALFPGLCRPECAKGIVPVNLPPYLDVKWRFDELTNCGATGDPTKATREKGLEMKARLVDLIAEGLAALDACDWDYCSPGVRR
jgi:creatinine amidohydrolase